MEHWSLERLAQVLGVKPDSASRALRRWKAEARNQEADTATGEQVEQERERECDTEPTEREIAAIDAEELEVDTERPDDLWSALGLIEQWDRADSAMQARRLRRRVRHARRYTSVGSSSRPDPPADQLELLPRAQCA